ncbi:WAT1-related protein [Melia azedarach]|uniref:WAT1-related protein n=1 Tax=Melia azedarach TaxID=155640 RepID=A0ACC1XJZ4_MELAZ|nr:WAT1-related protein [Melia azedarach]
MAEMKSSCNEWKPFIAMISIEFAFAITNIFLKKVLQEGMNDLVFITYRLIIATILLSPIAYFWERNSRPKLTLRVLCYLFFSAIVGTSLTQYFFLLGIQYTSATFACAFINMVPVITFIMALPFGFEAVNIKRNSGKAKVIGTLVCIGGAMMLTLYRGNQLFKNSHAQAETSSRAMQMHSSRRNERWTVGSIALTVGTLLWSSWFLIQSYISKTYPCQYSSTAIVSFFGVIQSAILSFSTNRSFSVWIIKGKIEIISVLYAGMVGSGLCFVGLSWCVKKKGPVFTAAFSPLVQIMAAMFDIPLLHEGLHLGSLLGSITVIIGLYILLWGKNKEMQNCASKVAQEAEENKEQEPQLQGIAVVSSASICP